MEYGTLSLRINDILKEKGTIKSPTIQLGGTKEKWN